jgi:hypothetical protein
MDWHNVLLVVKLIVTMLCGQSVGGYVDVLDQRNLHVSENNDVCQKTMLVTVRCRAREISVPTAFRQD